MQRGRGTSHRRVSTLEILRAYPTNTESQNIGEIIERTGLPKSTTSRSTRTLIHSDMLVYDGQRRAYLQPSRSARAWMLSEA
ncbi:helix-turn-helix domain-containing protein [Pseudomonas sp. St316]|uniref:helix-turn-helix domain-containing protein n=1 Tax=Pseudomonas sp. St316 TaxID=2678257 RepID=UPI001BB3A3BD|nr:helix-turn-helix domain-containing protein [Pseudomonas sp. St316]